MPGCGYWYDQCGGGLEFKGPTCCALGSTCVRRNRNYLQCLPKKVTDECQAMYHQCGGYGWTGATCCQEGSRCVDESEYYGQCLPYPGVVNGTGPVNNPSATGRWESNIPSSSSTSSVGPIGTGTNDHIHFKPVLGGKSGQAITTRYWDCCKPSCAWANKALVSSPVNACMADGVTVAPQAEESGCASGGSWMCNAQQPFAINATLAYGWAAASIGGYREQQACCSCMLLTFQNGPAAGQQLVVQIYDNGLMCPNQFDISIPGADSMPGCLQQWGISNWHVAQGNSGISRSTQCSGLPLPLQAGCRWRWDWMKGADNPLATFLEVQCPIEITSISGCRRR